MGQLVRIAGYDPTEDEYQPRNSHRLAALNRFRKGKDTLTIAQEMGQKERTILKWISTERSRRRGLRDPYPMKLESSSVVEHPPVKRTVEGSNPSSSAKKRPAGLSTAEQTGNAPSRAVSGSLTQF